MFCMTYVDRSGAGESLYFNGSIKLPARNAKEDWPAQTLPPFQSQ